ncbi:MAG TPA: hypothetical protein PK566_08595 [Pseudobacteroides sp.]|nr:hypothetical protein [Pseudobacteroides sp.]
MQHSREGIFMVNSVNSKPPQDNLAVTDKKSTKKPDTAEKNISNNADDSGVIVDIGGSKEQKVTYSNAGTYKPNIQEIDRLKQQAEDALAPLRQLVEQLLKDQGIEFKRSQKTAQDGEMVNIDQATRDEAAKNIAEDGEYGIEKTSQRLVDFAIAISGGDKSKLDDLKNSILDGYKEAEKVWGGKLPEICQKTIDRTMEKLDEWAKSE